MADEEEFKALMTAAGFLHVEARFRLANPRNPPTRSEVDNVGQKSNTLFVFEGKRGKVDTSQIKERFFLFDYNKATLIVSNDFDPYVHIRVFHYNLKKRRLVEFAKNGEILQTHSYATVNELVKILQNI